MAANRAKSTSARKLPRATFRLFDLRVEVEQARGLPMICNHKLGDSFELRGENLSLPPGQTFPLYSLAALLPLLPAKQRDTHPHDWMTTDTLIACPDPHCGGRFRITRIGASVFDHAEVTAVPLPGKPGMRRRTPRQRRER
jgi:uncharacterized repeat protein (TIGR04076 family)